MPRQRIQLKGGVGEGGDGYERHADQVADLVVRGESAESLLSQAPGRSGGGDGAPIQRKISFDRGKTIEPKVPDEIMRRAREAGDAVRTLVERWHTEDRSCRGLATVDAARVSSSGPLAGGMGHGCSILAPPAERPDVQRILQIGMTEVRAADTVVSHDTPTRRRVSMRSSRGPACRCYGKASEHLRGADPIRADAAGSTARNNTRSHARAGSTPRAALHERHGTVAERAHIATTLSFGERMHDLLPKHIEMPSPFPATTAYITWMDLQLGAQRIEILAKAHADIFCGSLDVQDRIGTAINEVSEYLVNVLDVRLPIWGP